MNCNNLKINIQNRGYYEKKVALIVSMLILQGCSSYSKTGAILPDNNVYYKEVMSGGSSSYDILLPYNPSIYKKIDSDKMPYKNTILLNMPDRVYDKDCKLLTWIFIPIYYGNVCGDKYQQENEQTYIYLYKPYYTDEIVNNVNISLRFKNEIYVGRKESGYGNNLKNYSYSNKYVQFKFPITIKDIKENGASLIVDYKNYHKEVPISYRLMWHRG